MMTAYLAFAALRDKKLDPAQELKVSARAAAAPGARMYATAGQAVSGERPLRAMIVQSANDAATALAEGIAGPRRSSSRR
jgi:D-alanyl-D-alanine carboxypeptidase (penicillin-binding protein 5/6)